MQCHVDAEQWRKRLVDAYGADVVHRVGDGIAGSGVGDESQSVHILLECAVRGIAANGEHAFVGMSQSDILEMVAQPRQFAESGISQRPVRQHVFESREDVERRTAAGGVGAEEGWYEHVGTVLSYAAYLGVECRAAELGAEGVGGACGINGVGILSFHLCAERLQRGAERLEGLRPVTVVGIAHTLECALKA